MFLIHFSKTNKFWWHHLRKLIQLFRDDTGNVLDGLNPKRVEWFGSPPHKQEAIHLACQDSVGYGDKCIQSARSEWFRTVIGGAGLGEVTRARRNVTHVTSARLWRCQSATGQTASFPSTSAAAKTLQINKVKRCTRVCMVSPQSLAHPHPSPRQPSPVFQSQLYLSTRGFH